MKEVSFFQSMDFFYLCLAAAAFGCVAGVFMSEIYEKVFGKTDREEEEAE